MKTLKKFLIGLVVLLICIVVGMVIYLGDYYHVSEDSISAYSSGKLEEIPVTSGDNYIAYGDPTADDALIFYPGGKVEYTAYEPLMKLCINKSSDLLCILVKMPGNLAVFDMNAADDIYSKYPSVKNWYIGGHSLGGAMAASYLEDEHRKYNGLILLGSYSTADLSETSLDALSIYGSEDKVLDMEKYIKYEHNLPPYEEYIIDGGCHSYFGTYGNQEGDGEPSISNDQQLDITSAKIADFIG